MSLRASYVPDDSLSVQNRVLNAITQASQQRNAPIDALDVAQMEDVTVADAQQAVAALTKSGQIQLVQGTGSYLPCAQMG
jgi:hypothetical protein